MRPYLLPWPAQQLHLRRYVHAVQDGRGVGCVARAVAARGMEGLCDLKGGSGAGGSARCAGRGRRFVGNREYRS